MKKETTEKTTTVLEEKGVNITLHFTNGNLRDVYASMNSGGYRLHMTKTEIIIMKKLFAEASKIDI